MKKFTLILSLLISTTSALLVIPAFAQSTQSTVTIVGHAFNPTEVNIVSGGWVTWNNTDPVVHSTTAIAGQSVSWDSGDLARNQSFSVVFSATGTYNYVCKYHSWMTGRVIVQGAAQALPTPGSGTSTPTASATPTVTLPTATAPVSTSTPVTGVPSTGGSDPDAGKDSRAYVMGALGFLVITLGFGMWSRHRRQLR